MRRRKKARLLLSVILFMIAAVVFVFNGGSDVAAREEQTIPISELAIGDRVVDRTWSWEFRTGTRYSGSGEIREVVWIVVAKNHPGYPENSVTLLAEECIALLPFDDLSQSARNNWEYCGTPPAACGVRPFLNSLGYGCSQGTEGFYNAFSRRFKSAVLQTKLVNKTQYNEDGTGWSTDNPELEYTTLDYVFVLSETELGGSGGDPDAGLTYEIGCPLPYFQTGEAEARRAVTDPAKGNWYWTRSPLRIGGLHVRVVLSYDGSFEDGSPPAYQDTSVSIRPALNIKNSVQVSNIPQNDIYEIIWPEYAYGDIDDNDRVDVSDAIILLKSIVGLTELNDYQKGCADVNLDESINVVDAAIILRYIAGLIDELPV